MNDALHSGHVSCLFKNHFARHEEWKIWSHDSKRIGSSSRSVSRHIALPCFPVSDHDIESENIRRRQRYSPYNIGGFFLSWPVGAFALGLPASVTLTRCPFVEFSHSACILGVFRIVLAFSRLFPVKHFSVLPIIEVMDFYQLFVHCEQGVAIRRRISVRTRV